MTAQIGQPFTFQMTAIDSPTSFTASNLPSGLSIDGSTGVISGTPSVLGTYPVLLSISNASGSSTSSLTLTVASAPVQASSITSDISASGQAGTAFIYQITATNAPTSYGASGLPNGLYVDAAGLVAGTPTQAGVFSVTLYATNAGGTGIATLSLNIVPVPMATPVIASAVEAGGQINLPFTYQITASNSPSSYGASGLPAGLSINTTNGLISGTPTSAGVFAVMLSATNGDGSGSEVLTLTLVAPAVTATVGGTGTAVEGGADGIVLITRTGARIQNP